MPSLTLVSAHAYVSKAVKLIVLFCLLFSAISISTAKDEQPTNVTMVAVIANPAQFNGKLIRVIGFLRMEFEGDVLYLHREDYEHAILGDGVWVDVTPQMNIQKKTLNMHYVLIEGVFSSTEHGHMGMWSGTIRNISRAQVWH